MGLLDSVIGGLAGQGGGGSPLLRILLALLANPGGGASGGGLGDVLGGVLGGRASADAGGGLGGLGGLLERMQAGGLGDVAGSWVSTGPNQPIDAGQLGGVLGDDLLAQIARQLGVSPGEAAEQVSQALPQVVDRLTPEGRVPEDLGDIGAILGRFQ